MPASRAVGYRNKIMRANPLKGCVLLLCIGILLPAAVTAQGLVLDDFESMASWKPIPSVDKTIVSCAIDDTPVTILHPHEISVCRVPAHIMVHF